MAMKLHTLMLAGILFLFTLYDHNAVRLDVYRVVKIVLLYLTCHKYGLACLKVFKHCLKHCPFQAFHVSEILV